ncbi:MAG: hypothetical protein Fur0023_09990 [Bacteroidia bacterium]
MKKMAIIVYVMMMGCVGILKSSDNPVTFSQSDRDRMIRMEAILEQHDKRFEDINKRFEDINKRFEDINKRFEDINKRFEDINKRIDEIYTFLWIMTGIFTALTTATIGFAIWDRRSMIKPFEEKTKKIEEKLEEQSKEPLARQLLDALKEKAKTDKELAQILRTYHLL